MDVKPGYTTTEFWVTLVMSGVAVISIFKPLSVNATVVEQIAAIAASLMTTIGYIFSRTRVKEAAAKALKASE